MRAAMRHVRVAAVLLGYDIKITTPLDWMGVTDHSEYVGTVRLAKQKLIVRTPADVQKSPF